MDAGSSTKKVLIVEDDKFLGTLLKNRLEKEGLSVLLAGDGEEALEILKRAKPTLTVLDIILPKKSGFEVMAEVQRNPALETGPVIIMTNLGQKEDVDRGKELGAAEYLIKSETPIEKIVGKIEELTAKN